jgi:dTDP-4-amino-4,6-dideoxygalactose transaminase
MTRNSIIWRGRFAIMAGRATYWPIRCCTPESSTIRSSRHRFVVPGYNVRPLEMCGAIRLEQLKKLDRMIERRANASLFVKLFENDERFIIQRENGRSRGSASR